MARSATGPRPIVAVLTGAVAGIAGVVGLAAADWPPSTEPAQPSAETAAAARRFVAEWRRSRLGTWALDGTFERVTSSGRRLRAEVHMAQRPPDRLVTGLSTVHSRQGDRRLACAPGPDGNVLCRDGGEVRPYAAEVADDIDILRGYVLGPTAFYGVAQDGPCFQLRLRRPVLSPPYGFRARFCFDPATGAPVHAEVHRREGRDVTVALQVRGAPTDADLDPER
jgi:hypothetical protein